MAEDPPIPPSKLFRSLVRTALTTPPERDPEGADPVEAGEPNGQTQFLMPQSAGDEFLGPPLAMESDEEDPETENNLAFGQVR